MIPADARHGAPCDECGAPMANDQRYCLRCGARRGAPRVDPLEALGFPALPAPRAGVPADGAAPVARPSPRLSAALAAATLVLGAAIGAALGPGPAPSPASAPQRLVALVTAVPAPAPVAATTPAPPAAVDPAPSAPAAADTSAPSAPAATTTGASPTPTPSPAPSTATPAPAATAPAPAPAPHVWIVSLTQLDVATAFGPDSPLADLVARGALLRGYTPVAPTAAANGVALLGGQVPAADCAADVGACALPASEPSLPGQVAGSGQGWKAYVEDPAARCAGPADRVAVSLVHALADRPDCAQHVVGLDALPADLAQASGTPELSLLVPAGVALDAAAAVHDLVARITASPAYRAGGLLLLVVDAPPPGADPAALPATGALVLSPRATAGQATDTATGPVALLRSLDDLLGAPALGAAAGAPAGALDGVLAPALPPRTTTTTTRRTS